MSTAGLTRTVVLLDGTSDLGKEELGGKAWGIDGMRRQHLPVPPAFTLPTALCRSYLVTGTLPAALADDLRLGLTHLEQETGRRFGAAERPLLVSVRSGAAQSMPGMMDTVLNLGCNAEVEQALARESGDSAWAQDVRQRFVGQYETVVLEGRGGVPEDPFEQLLGAVEAVLRSWNSPRALAYRAHHGLSGAGGTAVTVQAMVFGNADDRSGTGVLFTRDPLTGAREPYGEWLPRGQGDDVVSGTCTPLPLRALADALPEVHAQLLSLAEQLERDARDVQDIEFTVEAGTLWVLQTRNAKRAPRAAVRVAVEMTTEGVISEREALSRVRPEQVRALLRAQLDESTRALAVRLAKGEPACPGAACGRVVTDPDQAEELADEGVDVVLVRPTTTPEDVAGMFAAVAVVTEQGGATSHAALVSREIGVPCVVGTGVGTLSSLAGQVVTVDGTTGEVLAGALLGAPASEHEDPHLALLAIWAESQVGIRVHSSGDGLDHTPAHVTDVEQLSRLEPGTRSVALASEVVEDPHCASRLRATGVQDVVAHPRLPLLLALAQDFDL